MTDCSPPRQRSLLWDSRIPIREESRTSLVPLIRSRPRLPTPERVEILTFTLPLCFGYCPIFWAVHPLRSSLYGEATSLRLRLPLSTGLKEEAFLSRHQKLTDWHYE